MAPDQQNSSRASTWTSSKIASPPRPPWISSACGLAIRPSPPRASRARPAASRSTWGRTRRPARRRALRVRGGRC
eukprot:3459822-Prymnesium_polylepis.1